MMKFEDKLKTLGKKEVFDEYCSFIDLNIDEYMEIQNSLLKEQVEIWRESKLAKTIIKDHKIESVKDFKKVIPLTTYDDYADVLLRRDDSYLGAHSSLWIETTWEGGARPVKVAPYTRGMLETMFANMCACMIIATGKKRYDFDIKKTYHMLYGLAPLPYATGLIPLALDDQIGVGLLPDVETATKLSFSERNKLGFKQGIVKGIDYFFGLGSVTYYISKSIGKLGGGSGSSSINKLELLKHPLRLKHLLSGLAKAKSEGRELMPKDLFDIKGFVVAGTDNDLYKDDLEKMWGVRPFEIFAGTEPTLIGTELYSREGMVFFPDACYYEFIAEEDLRKQELDPTYELPTYTMDEVVENTNYELVLSVFKGGAFMRYRVGDMYRCVSTKNGADKLKLPLFKYIDRVRDVIDIAGFTRITENTLDEVIKLSKLDVAKYLATKEIDHNNRPYLHMYVEMRTNAYCSDAITEHVLKDHLEAYFKYYDSDYKDLKKILGIDPLKITILPMNSLSKYPHKLRTINPSIHDVQSFLKYVKNYEDLTGGSLDV